MVREARAAWRRGGKGDSVIQGEPECVVFESLHGQPGTSDATGGDQSLLDHECISRAFKFKASTILAGRKERRMGR